MKSSKWSFVIGHLSFGRSCYLRLSTFKLQLQIVFLVLLVLFIQGCQTPTINNGMQVQVVRVVSGQTLEATSMGKVLRVRLVGIEAPDIQQQPWGQAAKQQLETMVSGKTVILELDGQDADKFGRQWAYVWQNGKLLNEQLLQAGYVLWDGRSHNHKYDERLFQAQAWARIMGRGIWDTKQPMRQTPSEFRQNAGVGSRESGVGSR
jgi:micrococcal nuclease